MKCIEQNVPPFSVFIDLTKAFDTVNREAVWTVLERIECPPKFISMIRLFHDVATKAHECLKRLQGEAGSRLEETILSTILTSSDSSDRSVAEETNSISEVEEFCQASENEKTRHQQEDIENVIENERVKSSYSKKPMKFSKEKHASLKEGLRRHGFGHWTTMIRDKD